MKRLAILRHAKSSRDEPARGDLDRPLNERGWKDARRIGREMKQRGIGFDLVLASTAARVRETLEGVQESFDFHAPIKFEPRLYLADVGSLLETVRALPESVQTALLVGHNPGLERLVAELTRESDRLRQRIAEKFPTGALAVVELPAVGWADVAPGTGNIAELILPKELD